MAIAFSSKRCIVFLKANWSFVRTASPPHNSDVSPMPEVTIDSLAALLRYCERFSKQMLAEAGEFHPFAAFVNRDGQVEAVGAYTGDEFPQGAQVYQMLEGALASMAAEGKAMACAIAANVNVPSSLSPPLMIACECM
jgi:hypothetical protein